MGWIGVDLDGVLAVYPANFPEIGPPIMKMVERVKGWLAEGKDVRIFTARIHAGPDYSPELAELGYTSGAVFALVQTARIESWCSEHLGQILPITCEKDFQMIELWDDRCVQMITNTGESLQEIAREGLADLLKELRRTEGE